jgi:hypothetical protein
MQASRSPIPLRDYQRIFRVLKSVLDSTDAKTEQTSVFFSMAGAFLVQQVYKKRCQPVAGAAYYRLDDESGTVLSFADQDEKHDEHSSGKGFHCWVLCEGYIIDFMAPLFRESLHARGFPGNCSRKMFQKPLSAMMDSPLLMRKPGDFYMLPNVELTRKASEEFYASAEAKNLLNICMHWYKKPPKNVDRQLSIQSNDGKITHLTLSELSVTGSWSLS